MVDTGPLVAIRRGADEHHQRCVASLREIVPPLLTSWFVIAEAAYLLRESNAAVERLLQGPELGIYRILPLAESDLPSLSALVRKYRNLRPQLADVSLVHLANRESLETVFSLDRRDFQVFRTAKGKRLQLLPEGSK
ncbi:MAG: type II toxin-antitoxin system VapC family toxin [Pirellulales bacterium]